MRGEEIDEIMENDLMIQFFKDNQNKRIESKYLP